MLTSVFPNPSALWAGFRRCVFVHRPNLRESTTAIPLGITSDVHIPMQRDDKQRQREPSRRLQGRAPADYTTTGFGAQGYVPGESLTHCMGSATTSDLKAQRAAKSQCCAAWSSKRHSTLQGTRENTNGLARQIATVTSGCAAFPHQVVVCTVALVH